MECIGARGANSSCKKNFAAKELAIQANVPQRIVVESLIRLMRAGWVQMVQKAGLVVFQPTQSGLVASASDELPSASSRMSRNMSFVVDQVAGGVFRSRELPYLHTHMVEERSKRESIVWIGRPDRLLIEGIDPLIEALFQDDEKFVAMDTYGDRLAERWSLVTVRDGEVEGLSGRASASLFGAIKVAAQTATPRSRQVHASYHVSSAADLASTPAPVVRQVALTGSALVLGGSEHKDALISLLRRSRHRVVLHSTFIAESRFDDLLSSFRVAIDRGATVDIMWGQDESVEGRRSTREAVTRLKSKLDGAGLERLRVHPFSTGSHCKVLIGDDGTPARFTALVGSCNWLSTSFDSFEASLRFRDPLLISDVVIQLAELSRAGNGHWNAFTGELTSLASHLRASNPGATAKLGHRSS